MSKIKVVQTHHLIYKCNDKCKNKEFITLMTKGEHYLITQLNRHTKPSQGFIKCLNFYLALYSDFNFYLTFDGGMKKI